MEKRDPSTSAEPQPSTFRQSPQEGQNEETGWTMARKAIFWLLIVPAAVLLLVRWMLQA